MNGNNQEFKDIRLWYKKFGTVIFTSHLDMNRCFTRAVRRAGIPLWYTEGFNPHPYLNFILPLPLGHVGLYEPLDIRIVEDIPCEEIKYRLNTVLPEGIEIVDVTYPNQKACEIVSSNYVINSEFEDDNMAEAFAAGIEDVIGSGTLNAEKRSKKGPKIVNLCDYIKSFSVSSDKNKVEINTILATGTAENLNAGLLFESLCKEFCIEPENYLITRNEIFDANGAKFN